jgi:hypothetical protein
MADSITDGHTSFDDASTLGFSPRRGDADRSAPNLLTRDFRKGFIFPNI